MPSPAIWRTPPPGPAHHVLKQDVTVYADRLTVSSLACWYKANKRSNSFATTSNPYFFVRLCLSQANTTFNNISFSVSCTDHPWVLPSYRKHTQITKYAVMGAETLPELHQPQAAPTPPQPTHQGNGANEANGEQKGIQPGPNLQMVHPTPLHLLGEQSAIIDCPYCGLRAPTRIDEHDSSMTM